jgi:hypothetical protein
VIQKKTIFWECEANQVPDFRTQSFIIRVWIEPREIEGASVLWRGMAQLVSSGEMVSFQSFDELNTFIAKKLGIEYPPEAGAGSKTGGG